MKFVERASTTLSPTISRGGSEADPPYRILNVETAGVSTYGNIAGT